MSEKIGGAKGTELDEEFIEMERVSNRLDNEKWLQLKFGKSL